MQTHMLLTIVIANYNYGRFLSSAIESILAQKCKEQIEIIICDAGSTDDSVEVIKKFDKQIAWWCSEKDGGQSEAFNKGFKHAHGDWLTWLNADEVYCPHALERFIDYVEEHPSAKWVTGNYIGFENGTDKIISVAWGPRCQPWFLRKNRVPFAVFGPTSFWRRDVYEAIGPIDEKLHYAMDFDYWIRLTMAGIPQYRLDYFCWAFRIHSFSKTAGVQNGNVMAKRNAEMEYIKSKTGYSFAFSCKNPWYLIWLLCRCLDGSIWKRFLLRRKLIGKTINLGNLP